MANINISNMSNHIQIYILYTPGGGGARHDASPSPGPADGPRPLGGGGPHNAGDPSAQAARTVPGPAASMVDLSKLSTASWASSEEL